MWRHQYLLVTYSAAKTCVNSFETVQISWDFRCKMARIMVNWNHVKYYWNTRSVTEPSWSPLIVCTCPCSSGTLFILVYEVACYNAKDTLCCKVLFVPCFKFRKQLIIKFQNLALKRQLYLLLTYALIFINPPLQFDRQKWGIRNRL